VHARWRHHCLAHHRRRRHHRHHLLLLLRQAWVCWSCRLLLPA
jgi:hypothetical protein